MKKLSLIALLLGLTATTGFSMHGCMIAGELLGEKPRRGNSNTLDILPNAYVKLFSKLSEDIENVSKPKTELDEAKSHCESLRLTLPKESLAALQAQKIALEKRLEKIQIIYSSFDEDEYASICRPSSSKKSDKKSSAQGGKLKKQLEELNQKIDCYNALDKATKRVERLQVEVLAAIDNAQTDTLRIKSAEDKLAKILPKAIATRESECSSECAAIDKALKTFLSQIKPPEAKESIAKLATTYMQSLKEQCEREKDADIASFRSDYARKRAELQHLKCLTELLMLISKVPGTTK